MLCSEKLNYAIILKNVLSVKSTVLLIHHIDEMNSCYHLVVKQLYYRLKQDLIQNNGPNYYLGKVFFRKYDIVASLPYCVYQEACDL